MLFSQAREGYLLASRSEGKTPKTLAVIEWNLGLVSRWLQRDPELSEFTPHLIRSFISSEQARGLSPHSVNQEYRNIRAFLKWCVREEFLETDPFPKLRAPKLPDLLPKILKPEQVNDLFKYLDKNKTLLGRRDRLIIETFLGTGLRASELATLEVQDLNLESMSLIVRQGKGKKDRIVPITPPLVKPLWKYLHSWRAEFHPQCERVFVNRYGRKMTPHALKQIGHRALGQIGVKGSCHIFRHTYATYCLLVGHPVKSIQSALGHRDPATTDRYLHFLPEDMLAQNRKTSPFDLLH